MVEDARAEISLLRRHQPPVGLIGFVTLVLLIVLLGYRNVTLEQRILVSEARVSEFSERLTESWLESLLRREATIIPQDVEIRLDSLLQRVAALEDRTLAVSRVIGSALPSIMFLQAAYRFEDADSGQMLRYILGPDGEPLITPGGPAMSINGKGPVVERQLTGTAFVATEDRVLVTNRHLVRPWEDDEAAAILASSGFTPVLYRLIGYLPGNAEPIEVELVAVSDEADVAILKSDRLPPDVPHLDLDTGAPRPGDAVIVMGYPTGIQALLARADHRLVDELREAREIDFWRVARQLSNYDYINPLASLGIVGQVTGTFVVYDAETAQGGSGGPVLGLNGRVIAINAAIIPGFNGSNLGVPVERVFPLLNQTAKNS